MIEEFKEWKEVEATKHPRWSRFTGKAKFWATIVLFILFFYSIIRDAMARPDEIIERERQFRQPSGIPEKDTPLSESSLGRQNSLPCGSQELNNVSVKEQPKPADRLSKKEPDRAEKILNEIKAQRERQERRFDKHIDRQRGKESVVFWLLVFSGIVALVLLILGAFLLFRGNLAVGVLAELLALFPAAGTAIFWKLSRNLAEGTKLLNKEREDNLRILQAIHSTLLIPIPSERAQRAVEITKSLLDNTKGNQNL